MKRHPIATEYESGKLLTWPIGNCVNLFDESAHEDKESYHERLEQSTLVHSDNRETFRRLWGRQDFCFNNGEFYFHVWVREFEGETFLVLTAREKGTCIELAGHTWEEMQKMHDVVLAFWDDLVAQLKKLSPAPTH